MYISDDIAYAGDPTPLLKVNSIQPLEQHRLKVQFSNGECRIFDCVPLLSMPAFAPLADETLFRSVVLEHGIPVWNDGDIDIAPELLYEKGISA
ncbi:MAG: DUF2442 domain-containing protein [Clostridia bacterium]|nr:DUF2442 domain-containing protein [Clostridia bacterium]